MTEYKFHNAAADHIFYDTLWSYDSSCDKQCIIHEVDALRSRHPEGNIASNYGGWQSPLFSDHKACPTIFSLIYEISAFVNAMAEYEKMSVVVETIAGWANINEKHSYNSAHRHGNRTDFVAVYYPKFPEDSGPLTITRDGGGATLMQNVQTPGGILCSLKGEEGRVFVFSGHLLHFVHPHPSDTNRYSLSFNISCGPK